MREAFTTARDAGLDQQIGGLAVEIRVVDDDDVAVPGPGQHVGGLPGHPGRPGDSW